MNDEEYKKGFEAGFKAGFEVAQKNNTWSDYKNYQSIGTTTIPGCSVCGLISGGCQATLVFD